MYHGIKAATMANEYVLAQRIIKKRSMFQIMLPLKLLGTPLTFLGWSLRRLIAAHIKLVLVKFVIIAMIGDIRA